MNLKLLPHQWDFITSESKFTAIIAGIGSGKSFAGAAYIFSRVTQYPDALHFIGANTYSQLRDSTLAAMFSFLQDVGVEFKYNQNHGILSFAGGKILCKSMDNYDTLRGIEIATFWLDEVAYMKREAWNVIMGRLRDKRAPLQGRVTSSPAGFNWVYDYFHTKGEHNSKEFQLITASSYANKHLPEGYIESVKNQYDENLFKQEIMGEFISTTSGQVYYAFDRETHLESIPYFDGETVIIGMDFNVDPMTAVALQIRDGKAHFFKEFYQKHSDTFKMSDAILKCNFKSVIICPDSTGRNRKTSGQTDFQILKDAGFKINSSHNPLVFDRVNNFNRLLALGKIKIDPSCKKLINDLEKVMWKKNDLDKTTDKDLTHISDAAGYALWQMLKPDIVRPKAKSIRR